MRLNSNIVGVLGAVRSVALSNQEISNLIDDQIYPFAAPEQSNPPYIVTGIEGVQPSKSHLGQDHVLKYYVSMDVFAVNQTRIAKIADALINGLTNFNGQINDAQITRLWFESANTQNPIREGAGEYELIYTWSLVFGVSL